MPVEDDQLLAQVSILDKEFSFAACEDGHGIGKQRELVWPDPASKMV